MRAGTVTFAGARPACLNVVRGAQAAGWTCAGNNVSVQVLLDQLLEFGAVPADAAAGPSHLEDAVTEIHKVLQPG